MKMSRVHSFGFGLSLPFRALRLIWKEKTLLALCMLPLFISAAVMIGLLSVIKTALTAWVFQGIATLGWDPTGTVATILSILIWVAITLGGAFLFSALIAAIAAPFNDFIAEQTESRATPPLPPVPSTPFWKRLRFVWIDVLKTVAAVAASLTLLLLSWVPLLNFVLFVLNALLMTFQYTSYQQTRRGMGLSDGARFLFQHFYACFGFGSCLLLLYAIPIFSALTLPLAVVGGTLLVARAQDVAGFPRLR